MSNYKVTVINTPPYRSVSPVYSGIYIKSFVSAHTEATCSYVDLNAKLFKAIRTNYYAKIGNLRGSLCNETGRISAVVESLLSKAWFPFRVSFETITIEKKFESVRELYEFSCNKDNIPFVDLIYEDIDRFINVSQIIMFSVYSIEQLIVAIFISRMIKKNNPNKKVLWGGSLPCRFSSLFERNTFLFSIVDVIVIGDGETTNVQYVKHCMHREPPLSAIPGILYLDKAEVKKTKVVPVHSSVINSLAMVDYSDINLSDYPGEKVIFPLMCSRECYYRKCAFCDNYSAGSNFFRYRMTNRIIHDVINACTSCGAKYFRFIDDSLPVNVATNFAKALLDMRLSISWGANIRCERAFCDSNTLNLLRSSGCKLLFMGAESGSDYVLNLMNKGISSLIAQKVIRRIHDAGIGVQVSFMFGFPGEREEDAIKTCDFILKNIDFMDLVEINYFIPTTRSKVHSDLCRENTNCHNPMPFVAIDIQNSKDFDKIFRSKSYSCYCEIRNTMQKKQKTPSFERIRAHY